MNIDEMETERIYQKWKNEYYNLENDFDIFRTYFIKNKKCDCHIDECKHFDKALIEVLGERTNKLCKSRIEIGFKTHYSATRENN